MLEYRWANPDTRLFFYQRGNAGFSDIIGKTLKGQFLTVEEAMAMANDFMAQMAPDYELRVVFGAEGEKGDAVAYPTLAYCFTYTRHHLCIL